MLQVTIMIPAELRDRVAQEAAHKSRSFAGQCRYFLTEGLQRVEHRNGTATALPSLGEAKRRLEQMKAEHARLAGINEADAESRARDLNVQIHILGREIEVAELVLRSEE